MRKRTMLKHMHFGWQLLGGMAVLIGAGYWLDLKMGSQWCTVIGLVAGVGYGALMVWRLVRDSNEN